MLGTRFREIKNCGVSRWPCRRLAGLGGDGLKGLEYPEQSTLQSLRRVMTKIYLGELEESEALCAAAAAAGLTADPAKAPDEPDPAALAVVRARIGITSSFRHELNNPLTAVLGFAELLSRNSDLPQDVARKVDQIQVNAERLKEMLLRHESV